MIHPLKGREQRYDWGSESFIQELIGLVEDEPQALAELWLGAHPKAAACIKKEPLDQFLHKNPQLAGSGYSKEQALPYLMKVLAAKKPLSIQAHPNKKQAEAGFAKENSQGLALDDPTRNYSDANHKPELICALTAFEAMCGFRPYQQIVQALQMVGLAQMLPNCNQFCDQPKTQNWKQCFISLLSLKEDVLAQTLETVAGLDVDVWAKELDWVRKLAKLYPQDCGALAPLYLNLVQLKPQQALFLEAGIPHAYLQGAAIEVMASSDNVLRAGLTPKHIDLDELCEILIFEALPLEILHLEQSRPNLSYFPQKTQDFKLGYAKITANSPLDLQLENSAIILCMNGKLNLKQNSHQLMLSKGEAAFCDALGKDLRIDGDGDFYLVT